LISLQSWKTLSLSNVIILIKDTSTKTIEVNNEKIFIGAYKPWFALTMSPFARKTWVQVLEALPLKSIYYMYRSIVLFRKNMKHYSIVRMCLKFKNQINLSKMIELVHSLSVGAVSKTRFSYIYPVKNG
jgi:hypothetical protein